MSNYTEKDTNPMSWDEMNGLINILIEKIDKYFTEHDKQVHVVS